MSRITEYRRVTIGPLPESTAVIGEAVEGLVHALAELLDNATRYSPPHTHVVLTAMPVPDGLIIEVEDSGVGLGPEAAARAAQALATEHGLEDAVLGATPRLGLAVVGRLARAVGFDVSLSPSDGGGVRASILLPVRLVVEAPLELEPEPTGYGWARPEPARAIPAARHAAATDAAPATATATATATTVNGLPRRRRYAPTTTERPAAPPPPTPSQSLPPAPDAGPGQWLGQLHGPPREGMSPRKMKEGMAP
jgi:cell division septation protein DedD